MYVVVGGRGPSRCRRRVGQVATSMATAELDALDRRIAQASTHTWNSPLTVADRK